LSRARRADHELDALIDEITIDCYNDDEALTAFENAFDEDGHLPCPGTVSGDPDGTRSPCSTSTSKRILRAHACSPPTAAGSACRDGHPRNQQDAPDRDNGATNLP